MSRSYKKKAIVKIEEGRKDIYNKTNRKHFKRAVDKAMEDPEEGFIEPPIKAKLNDYSYINYVSNCENTEDCYCIRNFGRKNVKKNEYL
jgi:hypothetical protein